MNISEVSPKMNFGSIYTPPACQQNESAGLGKPKVHAGTRESLFHIESRRNK